MMMIRRLAVVSIALFLAGCAGTSTTDSGTPPGSSASPSSGVGVPELPPPDAPPPVGPPSKPPGDGSPGDSGGSTETVIGTVVAGVEPNCLLIKGGKTEYLLVLRNTRSVPPQVGSKVRVVGRPEPGMMSTCQQGTPFVVSEIGPA